MTIPSWPTDLPDYVITSAFNTTPRDGRLRSPMELGPPKVRRRSTGMPQPVSGSFFCDLNEISRFTRFWTEELEGGVLAFWVPDRMFDDAFLESDLAAIITTNNDEPITVTEWWLAQFAETPQISNQEGRLYQIAFSLILLP